MKPTLYHLSYSPYSERARWALAHHGVEHVRKHHTPTLGEPALRLALRRFSGPVSVPVLVTDGAVFDNSLMIAQYAEEVGTGSPLFPRAHMDAILNWDRMSERSLGAARVLVVQNMLEDDKALDVALPKAVPRPLRWGMRPVTRSVARRTLEKYAHRGAGPSRAMNEAELCRGLDAMTAALADQPFLTGEAFTYADITMCMVLQGVDPVDSRHIAVHPVARPCWENSALARQYQHLLEWRDRVYRRFRETK